MSLAERLDAWGILRAAEVVKQAGIVQLDPAVVATLLEKESGGGRNVWGSDPVPTGGAYVKGSEVTPAAYRAYRAAVQAGTAGPQGVGPCQLTWLPYQDQADRLGGCWNPVLNMRVGLAVLADLQRRHGEREGFRRYNGSGPAAEEYAADAVRKLARWRDRLALTGSAGLPRLQVGDANDDVRSLQEFLVRVFPAYARFPVTGYYGPATTAAVAEFQRRSGITGSDADGETVGPRTNAALWAAGYRG